MKSRSETRIESRSETLAESRSETFFKGFRATHSPRQRLASIAGAMRLVSNLAVCNTQFEEGKTAFQYEQDRALCFDNFIFQAREVLGLVRRQDRPRYVWTIIYYDHEFDAHCIDELAQWRKLLNGEA